MGCNGEELNIVPGQFSPKTIEKFALTTKSGKIRP